MLKSSKSASDFVDKSLSILSRGVIVISDSVDLLCFSLSSSSTISDLVATLSLEVDVAYYCYSLNHVQ